MFENIEALLEAFGGLLDSAAEAFEKMADIAKAIDKSELETEQKKHFREFVCARSKKRGKRSR